MLNSFVQDKADVYLTSLNSKLRDSGLGGGLAFFQGLGGGISLDKARQYPLGLLGSGPAGGAIGANELAKRMGKKRVLLGDMAASVSLESGVTAISMDYGTVDLATRIARNCPTHFITLQTPSEDQHRALSSYYVVEPVKEWDVFENYYEHRPVRLSRLRPKAGRLPSCPASP